MATQAIGKVIRQKRETKMPVQYCSGCENDFYNGHNPMGIEECWSRAGAKREPYLLISIDQRPPYKQRMQLLPTCYRAKRMVKVKKEALDAQGYWKW